LNIKLNTAINSNSRGRQRKIRRKERKGEIRKEEAWGRGDEARDEREEEG
jgi:hypothetical protein